MGRSGSAAGGVLNQHGQQSGDVEQPIVQVQNAACHEGTPLKPARGLGAKFTQYDKDEEPISLVRHPILWVQALSRSYSWRLLTMVVITNHLLKGFVAGGGDEGLVGKPIEFLFAELGVSATRLQMLKAVAISPWALKPVLAIMSDACPILGYKKMPYVIIFSCGSMVCVILLGLGFVTTVHGIVACLFGIFLQISAVDLLVSAKQSEEVKQKAKLGPQFFTFSWLGINAGQVASVCVLGPVIHHYGPRWPYLFAIPIIALVFWPPLGNFLGERRLPPEERGFNFKMVHQHPVLCLMTILMGVLVLLLIVGTFTMTEDRVCVMALAFGAVVMIAFGLFIRWEIAGPIIFYFLLQMLSFNVDGALFYFYTNSAAEYPEGPHFTAYFYTTALGAATFVGFTFGFITGEAMFKDWSYRSILKLTITGRCLTQLALVPALLRWTPQYGLPDGIWVLCVVVVDSIVYAWRWIPKQVMQAHLTPRGVEATMCGLSAGTFNLAMILSSYCGGYLLHRFGVQPSGVIGESAMFSDLWKVQVIAACAPCVMLFLLPGLVPTKRQTEALITDHLDSATHGSNYEAIMSSRVGQRQREQAL